MAFRNAVGKASALIIASPEYAHGISGVSKNALDWLVSYEGFVDKPIALVNASPRARHAFDALHEVLRTMSANIISMRLRRKATGDFEIKDNNNGYGHEKAFVNSSRSTARSTRRSCCRARSATAAWSRGQTRAVAP